MLAQLTMMEITLNNQLLTVEPSCTLEQLLSTLSEVPPKGIALALNQEIIPKGDWSHSVLRSGDSVILIKATQGG